jgi:hypothetical protein
MKKEKLFTDKDLAIPESLGSCPGSEAQNSLFSTGKIFEIFFDFCFLKVLSNENRGG